MGAHQDREEGQYFFQLSSCSAVERKVRILAKKGMTHTW